MITLTDPVGLTIIVKLKTKCENTQMVQQQQSLINQIYLVTLRPTQMTQASFLQKKSNVAKWFFYIFL